MITLVLLIAIRGKRADELPLPAPYIKRGTHLHRNVAAILVVDNVFKRYYNTVCRGGIRDTVDLVVYGNEADVKERKHSFKILACFHVVSSETR
jgi:hypothetical protein